METIKTKSLKKQLKRFLKIILNKDLLKAEILYPFIYKFSRKYFNHYLWPSHVQSRNYFFKTSNKYKEGELINLGGGRRFFAEKWLNVDFLEGFEDGERGYNGKIGMNLLNYLDKLPFKNVKQFFISHVIEQFKIEDSTKLLKACFNSCEKNSIIRIIVPNSDLIINRLRENDLEYFKPIYPCFHEKDRNLINRLDLLYYLLLTPKCRFHHKSYSKSNESINRIYKDSEYNIFDRSNDEIIELLNNNNCEQNNIGLFHVSCFNSKNLINILKEIGFSKVYESAFMQSRSEEMRNVPTFDGRHPWLSLYVEAIK